MINWKTTLGGACTATGALLMGLPLISAHASMEIPSGFSHLCVKVGVVMLAAGTFWTGLFARDTKVSDEQAGAGQIKPKGEMPPLTPDH
jgi:hypothetical protein